MWGFAGDDLKGLMSTNHTRPRKAGQLEVLLFLLKRQRVFLRLHYAFVLGIVLCASNVTAQSHKQL